MEDLSGAYTKLAMSHESRQFRFARSLPDPMPPPRQRVERPATKPTTLQNLRIWISEPDSANATRVVLAKSVVKNEKGAVMHTPKG